MKQVNYGKWDVHPEAAVYPEAAELIKVPEAVIWRRMITKHEGSILYFKLWNFWVRAGVSADLRSDIFSEIMKSQVQIQMNF